MSKVLVFDKDTKAIRWIELQEDDCSQLGCREIVNTVPLDEGAEKWLWMTGAEWHKAGISGS